MAIKALRLRLQIKEARAALEAAQAAAKAREERENALAEAIEQAETAEDRAAVEAEFQALESDDTQGENLETLAQRLAALEEELRQEEALQNAAPVPINNTPAEPEERSKNMPETVRAATRRNLFAAMPIEQRQAIFADEKVKEFLTDTRAAMNARRAINNVGLTIPEVLLGVLRENILRYSKLYDHVNVRNVRGEARQIITGAVQEAVWTECCAYLNEMTMAFYGVDVDCYKVGSYIAVCNANLEDSDIDLASEILIAMAQGIGLALDKAILYGTGTKMPLGIVTRLAQTTQPADYPQTARPWVDLHTSNIKTIANNVTGVALFAAIALNAAASKGKYSRGERVWIMNETTYSTLSANAMSVASDGRIVVGIGDRMPGIGGIIEVLDFIPDNVIIGGFMDLYLLAERAGNRFATSEHVRFLQDQTVFKATARYDGVPEIAEGFVAIGINGVTPTAEMTFAPDEANVVQGIRLATDTATVAVGGRVKLAAILDPAGVSGTVTWASATPAKATVDTDGTVTGVAAGSSIITATCNGLTASCTVTVTA